MIGTAGRANPDRRECAACFSVWARLTEFGSHHLCSLPEPSPTGIRGATERAWPSKESGCLHESHSGNGSPFVSGANGRVASPIKNTRHIVTPAYRIGSGKPANTRLVRNPKVSGPAAATKRPTL